MASLFSQRHLGYKAGLLLAFASFVVFLVGFAAPNWIAVHELVHFQHGGLWEDCISSTRSSLVKCERYVGHHTPGWLKRVQALKCLALIGFLVLGFYAIITNFMKEQLAFTRIIEVGILVPAGVGLTGVFVFGVEIKKAQASEDLFTDGYSVYSRYSRLSWAFYLTNVGCVSALVSAVVIGVFNKPLPPATTLPVAFHYHPAPGVPEVILHAPVMVNYPVRTNYDTTAYLPPDGYSQKAPMLSGGQRY